MKKWLKRIGVLLSVLLCVALIPSVFAAQLGRGLISLSDEVRVAPVFVPLVDDIDAVAPTPVSIQGTKLAQIKSLIDIQDAKGISCFCYGDYEIQFLWKGQHLISFQGHLKEDPPRLISSSPLNVEPKKAHRLAALLARSFPPPKPQ